MRQEVKIEQALNLKNYLNKTMEGYYLGHRGIRGNFGEQTIHDVKTAKGKISVYGFTSLNLQLDQVEPGTKVWITYTGKSTEKNKYGQQVHQCRVECDFEDKLDLPKKPEEDNNQESDEDSVPF
jgi:hypothetical protein